MGWRRGTFTDQRIGRSPCRQFPASLRGESAQKYRSCERRIRRTPPPGIVMDETRISKAYNHIKHKVSILGKFGHFFTTTSFKIGIFFSKTGYYLPLLPVTFRFCTCLVTIQRFSIHCSFLAIFFLKKGSEFDVACALSVCTYPSSPPRILRSLRIYVLEKDFSLCQLYRPFQSHYTQSSVLW